ncbi:MAG: type II secretion system protein [bacterium]
MKNKKGMTLAEILLVMVMLSILAAISIPLFNNTKNAASRNEILYKSAFSAFSKINNEIIQDWNFPGTVMTNTSPSYLYCNEFAKRLILAKTTTGNTPVECSSVASSASSIPSTPNFVTINGMRWYGLNNVDFTAAGGLKFIKVYVDVDGVNKGKNTIDSDILPICVAEDGKIWPCSTTVKNLLLQ